MRHGEAVAAQIDGRRPLTSAGREDVERVAVLASARFVQVTAIYHSGILRARQTAEILAARLVPIPAVLTLAGLQPDDDPSLAAAELELAASPIMLVGHLPHLNRLAALLAGPKAQGGVIDFAPAMMACYRRDIARWSLVWTIMPR